MAMNNGNRRFMMFGSTPMANATAQGDDNFNSHFGSGKTPQFVITCKDIFSSDLGEIGGADASVDTAPCITIDLGSARVATYDSSGQQSGDGTIVSKDIHICMKYGSWGPIIQQRLYEGTKIDEIIIKRVISINGTLVVIQEITCKICMFKNYKQDGDAIKFSFCFVNYTDLSKSYAHDGTALGVVGVEFDHGTVGVKPISG
ncbi:MAG: hypothetical protein LBJ71_03315 [Holosporaceae bacterium]|jgi:hypothetical protein|nr:hypothetical protein [Holosporaceae bacterium]